MKKFISALTSLTIAATALGSTFAMSSTAATNGTVGATEITFLTGGQKSITVQPGAKIPVDMYVTASAGFYTLNLKMVMKKDGKLAFGEDGRGSAYNAAWAAANEPASKLADIQAKINEINATADADKQIPMVEDHWVYGTYGFGMTYADEYDSNSGFFNGEKLALDSGYYSSAGAAGTPGGSSFFVPENFSLTYFCEGAAKYTKGEGFGYADAYYGFESSGLTALKWLTQGTPINTWDNTESWIYDHVLNKFYLTVPEDAVPGTYTLELLDPETKYYNPAAISWTNTYAIKGDNTDNKVAWNGLTITVEGEATQTTTTPKVIDPPTTTTTSKDTPPSGEGYTLPTDSQPAKADGTLRFELVPDNENSEKSYELGYDASAKKNTIIAEPGDDIFVKLTASSDPKCAAQMIIMDFSQVEYQANYGALADAYAGIAPTVNDTYANTADSLNQKYVSVVWAATADLAATKDAAVCLFEIKVPAVEPTTANLVYTIDKTTAKVETQDKEGNTVIKERSISVIGDPDIEIPAEFIGLQIVVPAAVSVTTTTTPKETEPPVTTTTTPKETTPVVDTTTSPVGNKVWGDTNEDGEVTIADVVLLNKGMSGNATLSNQAKTNADTDNSGDLSAKDAYLIKGYLAKLIAKGTTDPAKLDAAIAAQK